MATTIGANDILPTSRSARYTGGLWWATSRRSVAQRMTPAASRLIGKVTDRQCQVERMLAHTITAQVQASERP